MMSDISFYWVIIEYFIHWPYCNAFNNSLNRISISCFCMYVDLFMYTLMSNFTEK